MIKLQERAWYLCLVLSHTPPRQPAWPWPSWWLLLLPFVPVGKGAQGAHAKLGAGIKQFSLTACSQVGADAGPG